MKLRECVDFCLLSMFTACIHIPPTSLIHRETRRPTKLMAIRKKCAPLTPRSTRLSLAVCLCSHVSPCDRLLPSLRCSL